MKAKQIIVVKRKIIAPSRSKTYIKTRAKILEWVKSNSTFFSDNSRWYCGITNNPNIRKAQHEATIKESPYFFKCWCVKSVRIAKALETSMHNKGMLDKDIKGGARLNSWYIYVFKKYPTIIDRLIS